MVVKRKRGRPVGTTVEKEPEINVRIRFPKYIKDDAEILAKIIKQVSFNTLVVDAVLDYVETYRERIDKAKELLDNINND